MIALFLSADMSSWPSRSVYLSSSEIDAWEVHCLCWIAKEMSLLR